VHDINILAINTPRQLKFVALLDRLWHVHLNVSATTPNGGTQFHGWIDIKLDTNLEALGASQMQVFFFATRPRPPLDNRSLGLKRMAKPTFQSSFVIAWMN
jgi:hypothetical protein